MKLQETTFKQVDSFSALLIGTTNLSDSRQLQGRDQQLPGLAAQSESLCGPAGSHSGSRMLSRIIANKVHLHDGVRASSQRSQRQHQLEETGPCRCILNLTVAALTHLQTCLQIRAVENRLGKFSW